jgi:hypothetical protein
MSFYGKSADQPIVAEGGLDGAIGTPSDQNPYAALDDLMVVIEALCPRWPERESSLMSGKFLL